MRVHMARCPDLHPNRVQCFELDEELLFTLSEAGASQYGVDNLVACWGVMIDTGVWRYQQPDGITQRNVYHHQRCRGRAVVIESNPGLTTWWLSPTHFAAETVHALAAAAAQSWERGWRYYEVSMSVPEQGAA